MLREQDILLKVRSRIQTTGAKSNASNELILEFIRDAVKEFSDETRLNQKEIFIDLQDGVCDYLYDDEGSIGINSVQRQGENGQYTTVPMEDYSIDVLGKIVMAYHVCTYDRVRGLRIVLAMGYDMECHELPEFIRKSSQWDSAIADIATKNLYAMRNQDWYSASQQSLYEKKADEWIGKGRGFQRSLSRPSTYTVFEKQMRNVRLLK